MSQVCFIYCHKRPCLSVHNEIQSIDCLALVFSELLFKYETISACDCRWELEVTELSRLRKEWMKLYLYEAGQGDKQAMIWGGGWFDKLDHSCYCTACRAQPRALTWERPSVSLHLSFKSIFTFMRIYDCGCGLL